jgi:hypothetical protein
MKMRIHIRAWQKKDEVGGMGNGVLGDAFVDDLEVALQNGMLFVRMDGTYILYAENDFGELPDAALFLIDMQALSDKEGGAMLMYWPKREVTQ